MAAKRTAPPPIPTPEGAGLGRYLKEAFLFRWNLLLFLAGSAAAMLTPWPDVVLPLVAAGELAYLGGLISIPRFRAAIDAKAHSENQQEAPTQKTQPTRSVEELVAGLPVEARRRFEALHRRCLEMRSLAHGVRGTAARRGAGDDMRTPALDRLLWVFLRLLVSQTALNRFLDTTDEPEMVRQIDELKKDLEAAQQKKTETTDTSETDERIARSLRDSVAVAELRLDNYRRAEKNAEFVAVELDRIEGKIQVLTEMSVSRQDPDFLSRQVDSVTESMRQTEKAIHELQHITGLTDELEEPPAILESNLKEVLKSEA
jgi:chemotaxis protein histidine kinase CheA